MTNTATETELDNGPAAIMPRPRGRGALSNRSGRFEPTTTELVDDGWRSLEGDPEHEIAPEIGAQLQTIIGIDTSRTIISRNDSPDIGFDRSINPYKKTEPLKFLV